MSQLDTRQAAAALLAVLALTGTPSAHAHPGKVKDDGCHIHRETGDFHCHRWLRVASWNLNGLHWRTGHKIFSRTPARTHDDYRTLARYANRLNADVIAFQEVNGPRAAERIFPPRDYSLFLSGRHDPGRDDIHTGFAVRKGRFDPGGVEKRDYAAIGLGMRHSLRWGVDLTIRRQGRTFRLLNVHLKAGCTNRNLRKPPSRNCRTLARQIEPLEQWIDARWHEGMPFIVIGGFNRTFDQYGARDHLWENIDDGDPPGLRLHRLPLPSEGGRPRPCWHGTDLHYRHPVDFFVFGARAWQRVDVPSFRELTWDREDANPRRKLPSDHCPITVDLF